MEYTKGGRGKKAPYETTHCRVPKQLKPLIDKLTGEYKKLVGQPEALNHTIDTLTSLVDDTCTKETSKESEDNLLSQEEAMELGKKILRSKKGNKQQQMEKLLTAIYKVDITLD